MPPHPTDKAWVAGWDSSITGAANPYRRRPQWVAFEKGRKSGARSSEADVRVLQVRVARLARKAESEPCH